MIYKAFFGVGGGHTDIIAHNILEGGEMFWNIEKHGILLSA